MHATAQWHALVGSVDPDDLAAAPWSGGAPEQGNLDPDLLPPLCALLEQHTTTAERCFFGLWAGWTSVEFQISERGGEVPGGMKSIRSGSDLPGPRFGLPPETGRDYALLSGPLLAASEIAESNETGGLAPTSANLIWPADRQWFLTTDIDFDSTLVGGSDSLIESIADSGELEARRIEPSASLSADADTRNI